MPTCVLQHESIAAEGSIAAESQEEHVGAAFDTIWNVCAIETTQQGAEGVRPIVDVQEVITRLQAKPGYRSVNKMFLNICSSHEIQYRYNTKEENPLFYFMR